MTQYEFKLEYDKLVEVYPSYFGNGYKEKAVFSYIQDLDHKWWKNLANRIILSSNPRLDIADAARGEKMARKSVQLTHDMLNLSHGLSDACSEGGLNDVLKSFGANSLLEAVFGKKAEPEINGDEF